jgi:hypothetical protein
LSDVEADLPQFVFVANGLPFATDAQLVEERRPLFGCVAGGPCRLGADQLKFD